jgi:hypothetical protein
VGKHHSRVDLGDGGRGGGGQVDQVGWGNNKTRPQRFGGLRGRCARVQPQPVPHKGRKCAIHHARSSCHYSGVRGLW